MAAAKETPKIDLDSYITNYEGRLLIERLATIGSSNSHLAPEALHLAVKQAKQGINAERYTELAKQLQSVAPNDPLAVIDTDWIAITNRRTRAETERLDAELKQYKNNLIKESIRMGNEDLGNHYLAMGDCSSAFKCYAKMRESCTTPKHISEMNLKLLFVSITQQNWTAAATYRVKMSGLGISADERTARFDPLMNAATALANLNSGSFRDAANLFLDVNPNYILLPPQAGIKFQKEVISPNDIAIYGGLCALATMNSAELRTHVLENQPFRQFLELEPHLRRAISMFCNSKFTSCLAVLDSYAADYKLDYYLQKHFNMLYHCIRTKSLVQWLSAFSVVTFEEISKAFPPTKHIPASLVKSGSWTLEEELSALVKTGLNARIDSVSERLTSPTPDARLLMIENTLNMASTQERVLSLRLHRISMAYGDGLEVKAPKFPQFPTSSFGEPINSDGGHFTRGSGRKKEGGMGSFMV
ncbi:hypothetical protein BT63DRAFT_410274 [Microthyrium microscopicum]|uniref:PCI domain-containing protein n=1 Tax=Microthyrium microscopicum TaxID=703497 RepID=A0A6A6ULX8_9PEZI|nr:hypothetical protein BT63DRAFT_410274 [Microthyrium microscopicum]